MNKSKWGVPLMLSDDEALSAFVFEWGERLTEDRCVGPYSGEEDVGRSGYEWKCNADNQPSMKTAKRLGFQFEGTFRQDQINHGRNRDTAWWSIIDSEWPRVKQAYKAWLSDDNFDSNGRQKQRLFSLL